MATTSQVIGASILLALYGIAILYFVIKGAKGTKSISDYALGSISFSPVFVGLSLAAAMTSAATFVINPGLVATFGVSGFLSFGIFFPLASLISLWVLTKSFRKYGQSVKANSLASWMGSRYQSKGYALFVAFLSVLLITFIVLILVALTKVIAQALNANQILVLAALVIFIFGYMMFGGANSMVYTNVIQATIMIVVAIILIGSGIQFFKDGVGSFFEKLRDIDPNLVKTTNSSSPLFRDFFEIIIVQMIVGAAVVCQPHIITKSLLLKKESDVNRFLYTAIGAEALFFLVVVAGLYARVLFPDMTQNGVPLGTDGIIPAFVIQIFAGGFVALLVGLLVILGLISAGMSTIEGLIQSLSITITSDIVKPLAGHKIKKEESYITINKLAVIGLAIVSFFIARDQLLHPKLSVAILAQNGVYAYFSVIFIPIVFGIFLKDVGLKAPLFASITALMIHFTVYYGFPVLIQNHIVDFGYANTYFSGVVRNPAIAAASAIVSSLVVGFLVHWLNRRKEVFPS
ncbi:MAG: hypothetical protein M0P66_02380 [Salinivirgaceae bacterium]|nr:hypothetical protein [Salinivirgaceae bacterium]